MLFYVEQRVKFTLADEDIDRSTSHDPRTDPRENPTTMTNLGFVELSDSLAGTARLQNAA